MAKAKATDGTEILKETATTGSIWKALGEEFFLEGDFSAIAEGLGLSIDQIVWTIHYAETDGVEGHVLTGVPV